MAVRIYTEGVRDPNPPCAVGANSDLMNTISHPYGALQLTIPKDGVTMIFLLQEEITDGLEVFKAWFEAEAIPQIEAAGGGCLPFGSLCKRPNDLGRRRNGDSSQRLA